MGKKPDHDFSDFSDFYKVYPPPIKIVSIRYADGREVTADALDDAALLQELREYLVVRDLHHLLPNLPLRELRAEAQEIAETDREIVSERNRRTASRPRGAAKHVTKQALLAHRDDYLRRKDTLHGWQGAACRAFHISRDTLRARLKNKGVG
ncbi:MAG TPA: hypothetical protein VLK85_11075 [Ramlibacter sp.]|nr:hypothetical protein [Ramlibacter sp.]